MSVTVYVEDWDKEPFKEVVVWADEEFPLLDTHYFESDPDYEASEAGRFFRRARQYKTEFPTMNVSNRNWSRFSDGMGLEWDGVAGSLDAREVAAWIQKMAVVMYSREKQSACVREPFEEERVIDGGAGTRVSDVSRYVDGFLSILEFAQSRGKGVYWC